ncbi:Utp21-domain-containing protein [Cylindrobasidium torrendii FP15055 ss-10]|uniref:Utp21-domain-containing protein n=1 Tax=Cylindrobasidium torrendii FP15055 ss-10 TaxID=1314674 RepID=A0A0D7BPH9_9AGAR|nr:Utp21-domain-containing protein [Cylindrobasidium torrendii FP15055 ss-10]
MATTLTSTEPPRKKIRKHVVAEQKVNPAPRLFVPFRALGLVTNHIPLALQTRSFKGATEAPKTQVLTCLGKSWALWDGGKMTLLFVGPETKHQISCLLMDGDAVWASSGFHLTKYIRGKEVLRLSSPFEAHLSFALVFGPQILALDEEGGYLFAWDTTSGELQSTIQFDPGFTATRIIHPATYVNKVLVASSQGSMQLWNIQTKMQLYTFTLDKLVLNTPSTTQAITALVQSTTLDIVAIGFTSGEISIYNIRTDERLMRLFMDGGAVRALGFRSDGEPILVSASSTGHLAVWDLEEGKLLHMVKGAHDGAITSVEWIPRQPIFMTSGEDNSVKQWLFESPTDLPRLLKSRSGHQAPPHLIRYYGDDGKQILTASRDRSLRSTSVVRDSRSFELSQGSLSKKATTLSVPLTSLKFPPVSSMSYSTTRAKDWDDIVTAHSDETIARTWTLQNKRVGAHKFVFPSPGKGKGKEKEKERPLGAVKAVCVTACGNFGLGGSATGAVHMWNMQSGILRRAFDVGPCPPEVVTKFGSSGKANSRIRTVTGIATDALNRLVIVATLDGTVNFFDFHTTALEKTVVVPSPVTSILLHRDNGLLALVCDDTVVRILDIETKRVVRELSGFRGRILDITFSPDSRWLIASSLDSTIRTFDVPTGRMIDVFKTSSVATSVAFSPTSDFLATAHVDSVGIFLWANRAQYDEVSFASVTDENMEEMALPTMQGTGDEELDDLAPLSALPSSQDLFITPPQLDGELVTLTLLPRARWQTLLNIDVIQHRNKPKEAPKAPEQAPFFLPTVPGVEQRFVVDNAKAKDGKDGKAKNSKRLTNVELLSTFRKTLQDGDVDGDYEAFFDHTKALSPAALDLEIRSLVTLDSLSLLAHALVRRLRSRKDFEAVQAMQSVFLKAHAEVLVENEEMKSGLEELLEVQQAESERVLELISSSLGTLSFVQDRA